MEERRLALNGPPLLVLSSDLVQKEEEELEPTA